MTMLNNVQDDTVLPDRLREIKKFLGAELTYIVFGSISASTYKKWIAGQPIDDQTKKLISTVYVICDTLSALPTEDARNWLVGFSNYIYGTPAIEIRKRPNEVLMAAQYLAVKGSEEDLG